MRDIPAPDDNDEKPLRALIFDSYYDSYKGVICSVRIVDGTLKAGDKIYFMASKKTFETEEVGIWHEWADSVQRTEKRRCGVRYGGDKKRGGHKGGRHHNSCRKRNCRGSLLPVPKKRSPMVYSRCLPGRRLQVWGSA